MELIQINGYFVTCQRQGNDRNGNPIFLVNVFKSLYTDGLNPFFKTGFYNCNAQTRRSLDKYGNIRIQSYNIEQSIKDIISKLNNV